MISYVMHCCLQEKNSGKSKSAQTTPSSRSIVRQVRKLLYRNKRKIVIITITMTCCVFLRPRVVYAIDGSKVWKLCADKISLFFLKQEELIDKLSYKFGEAVLKLTFKILCKIQKFWDSEFQRLFDSQRQVALIVPPSPRGLKTFLIALALSVNACFWPFFFKHIEDNPHLLEMFIFEPMLPN